ncbi:MAG: TadE/TadG family type IV pilus assembly protein [Roseovarius sp.]
MTRRKVFRRFLEDRRGAVSIEFAAIALPFILLLAGTMEISRYTWTRVALQDAASAGARCLGLGLAPCVVDESMDASATKEFVRQQATDWGIRVAPSAVTPDLYVECNDIASFGKVVIVHGFSSVLPALPDSDITVEACFPVASSV